MPVACGDGFSQTTSMEVLEALACIAETELEDELTGHHGACYRD